VICERIGIRCRGSGSGVWNECSERGKGSECSERVKGTAFRSGVKRGGKGYIGNRLSKENGLVRWRDCSIDK